MDFIQGSSQNNAMLRRVFELIIKNKALSNIRLGIHVVGKFLFKLESLKLESFCLSWKEPSEVGKTERS